MGGKTYRYDADGNLETDGEKWICTWDAENRLTSIRTWHSGEGVVTGDKKYVFEYDYDGRRYKKTTYTYSSNQWGAGTSYSFVWNGDHIIREKWSSGGEKFFTWGLEGKLLSMSAGVYNIYYGYDGNKNVTDLIRNGEYAHRYKYDAFGNVTSASSFIGVTINPFRFSSEYVDNETGWSAYKYRYYSPKIGRFLSRDRIEELGGLNLYGFVGNSPSYLVDLYGMGILSDIGRGALGLGSAVVNAGVSTVRAGGEAVAWGAKTAVSGVAWGVEAGYKVSVTALKTGSIAAGHITSILAGDSFDKWNALTEFDPCQCEFLVVINGINNDNNAAEEMRRKATEKFGMEGITVRNGTHFLWVGDIIQILSHEAGIIDVTSRRAAEQINAVYDAGKRNKCDNIKIVVVAHSQGTMVFDRALPLISQEVRKTIDYRGSGPQAFIGNNRGLGAVDNDWNKTEGKSIFGYDRVPLANYLTPRGVLFHLLGGNLDITTSEEKDGNNHTWIPFYSHNY